MKPTAYLLNAARGAIVDHDALPRRSRPVRSPARGSTSSSPTPAADHPLLAEERLLATPHTAFYSEESMRDLARLAAENVAAVLAGRAPASLVNPQILEERR